LITYEWTSWYDSVCVCIAAPKGVEILEVGRALSDINLDVSEESLQVTSIIAFKATILTEKSRY
jgi:hypothetical protein